MKVICAIPARYASSRLPGKPLAMIGNKPMIQWVYETAAKVEKIDKVVVATDHKEIYACVQNFNGHAVMTAENLSSGTDRVYEAVKNEQFDLVINLQGDEPFVPAELLTDLISVFDNEEIVMATPIRKIEDKNEMDDPNVVKVVRDINGFALYFSRSSIPYSRGKQGKNVLDSQIYFKHIGIYVYRKKCLSQITQLEQSALEKEEQLEQLRFLENGYKLFTVKTDYDSISVDTADDLEKVNKILQKRHEVL